MIVLVRHAEAVAPSDPRYEENDRPLAGGRHREAQRRVRGVLSTLRRRSTGGRIVVASHGNLIALALHAIAPERVDFEFWAAMPTPAVYVLPGDGTVSRPGFGD